jgi:predicted PurR-regulated permease PerM
MAEEQPDPQLSAAQQRAARQWQRLGDRIKAITPRGLLRGGLVAMALAALTWLIYATWPAVLVFIVGAAIAYTILPVVNGLNRVMPRALAAIIATVGVLFIIVAIPVLMGRVLVLELNEAYQDFPSTETINEFIDDTNARLDGWPAPVRNFVRGELQESLVNARQRLDDRVDGSGRLVLRVGRLAINTISVVLGLLVLPVWMLLVLRDQRVAVDSINRHLPDWMESDFWAVVRILERTFGAYLRGLGLLSLAIGLSTGLGLAILDRAGFEGIDYPVALALVAAVLELVPAFGPAASMIIAVGITYRESPESALAVLLLYIAIRLLVRRTIAQRVERRVIDVHPAVLVIVLVALSSFGLIWAILAAPLAALGRDLFRYTNGRLSDPPLPAGLLPGEPRPPPLVQPAPGRVRPAQTVPLVYQRSAARRQPAPTTPVEPS